MKVLVTGGGGLIGGYLAEALCADGHSVVATYRTTPPRRSGESSRLRAMRVDLAEPISGLEPADVIIHAAAHTHLIPNSTARDYVRSNVLGTLHLMEYARAARPQMVLSLSTLSVYGRVRAGVLDEDAPLSQPDLYGATKYVAELIAREIGPEIPVLCVCLPGVVGRGYFTPWLGRMLQAARRHEPVRIYNPQARFNNVVDLLELKRFVVHLMARGLSGSDRVNVAAAEPLRIREVAEQLIRLTGSRSTVIEEPAPGASPFWIDTDKLTTIYGFRPSTTRAIIERYVAENATSLMEAMA